MNDPQAAKQHGFRWCPGLGCYGAIRNNARWCRHCLIHFPEPNPSAAESSEDEPVWSKAHGLVAVKYIAIWFFNFRTTIDALPESHFKNVLVQVLESDKNAQCSQERLRSAYLAPYLMEPPTPGTRSNVIEVLCHIFEGNIDPDRHADWKRLSTLDISPVSIAQELRFRQSEQAAAERNACPHCDETLAAGVSFCRYCTTPDGPPSEARFHLTNQTKLKTFICLSDLQRDFIHRLILHSVATRLIEGMPLSAREMEALTANGISMATLNEHLTTMRQNITDEIPIAEPLWDWAERLHSAGMSWQLSNVEAMIAVSEKLRLSMSFAEMEIVLNHALTSLEKQPATTLRSMIQQRCYRHMMDMYRDEKRFEEAEKVLRMAMRLGEPELSPDVQQAQAIINEFTRPDLLDLTHLAEFVMQQERYEEAAVIFRQALSALESYKTPDKNRGSLQTSLAQTYTMQGKLEQAEELVNDIETGPDAVDNYPLLLVKAQLRWRQGRIEEAQRCFEVLDSSYQESVDQLNMQSRSNRGAFVILGFREVASFYVTVLEQYRLFLFAQNKAQQAAEVTAKIEQLNSRAKNIWSDIVAEFS